MTETEKDSDGVPTGVGRGGFGRRSGGSFTGKILRLSDPPGSFWKSPKEENREVE